MSEDTTRGIESPDTTHALTTKPTSDPLEGFDIRHEPTYGSPRKIGYEPTGEGDWLRISYEWTGCTWRELGYERCDTVDIEIAEQIPTTITRAVLGELFETAFAGDGVTDLDVLNAIARKTFGDEVVAEAKHRTRHNGGDN